MLDQVPNNNLHYMCSSRYIYLCRNDLACDLFKQAFIALTFPDRSMSLEQFEKFLQMVNFPDYQTNSQRYFR